MQRRKCTPHRMWVRDNFYILDERSLNFINETPLFIMAIGVFMYYDSEKVIEIVDRVIKKRECVMFFDIYSKIGHYYANTYIKRSGIKNMEVKLELIKTTLTVIDRHKLTMIPLFKDIKIL